MFKRSQFLSEANSYYLHVMFSLSLQKIRDWATSLGGKSPRVARWLGKQERLCTFSPKIWRLPATMRQNRHFFLWQCLQIYFIWMVGRELINCVSKHMYWRSSLTLHGNALILLLRKRGFRESRYLVPNFYTHRSQLGAQNLLSWLFPVLLCY